MRENGYIEYFPESVVGGSKIDLNIQSCNHCNIRSTSMCSAVKDYELEQLSIISQCKVKKANEIICSEGEKADYLYNLRKGCVRVSKMLTDGRRQIIDFLFAGEYFGLACSNGYSYTVEAITSVDLCQMPRDKIFQKFIDLPAFGQKVLNITISELQDTEDQIVLLGRKKATEKLCWFLLKMNKKAPKIENPYSDKIYIPMSRADIADYLGLTIETVSRQFTLLMKENVISLDKTPFVTVLDKERLNLIASGE